MAKKVYVVVYGGASQEGSIEVTVNAHVFSTPAKARKFELAQLEEEWGSMKEDYGDEIFDEETSKEQKEYIEKVKNWSGNDVIAYEQSDIEVGDTRLLTMKEIDDEE